MKKENKKLSIEEISLFSRQLALVIESDISLQEGLKLIGLKDQNSILSNITAKIVNDINAGMNLTQSIKGFKNELGDFFINMVEIGEKSGNLSSILNQIADSLDKQHEAKQKIKSALAYPGILTLLMLAVIIVLIIYVMPMFNEILASMGGTVPSVTKLILDISLLISKNIIWILAILVIIIGLIIFFKHSNNGKRFFNKLTFFLPVQKDIISASLASRFARNLALLIRSGINMVLAMEMIRPVMNNSYIEEKIKSTSDMLKKGEPFDKALQELKIFPELLIKLMAIAYGTGHIDKMLDRSAEIMDKELDSRLDKLATVIEPLLIVILSLVVGIILISVILPVAGIINSIG